MNFQHSRGGYKITHTPWGESDYSTKIARGIISYSTPGHGGIHVSARLNAKIPEYMLIAGISDGVGGRWYEEDCAWSIVAVVFPQFFPKEQYDALGTFKNWYPEAYEKYFGVELKPGESYMKDQKVFDANHKNDYLVESVSGDWKEGVPKGFVYCMALKGGRDEDGSYGNKEQVFFLVPTAEYETRGNFPFVIDETRHQRIKEIK